MPSAISPLKAVLGIDVGKSSLGMPRHARGRSRSTGASATRKGDLGLAVPGHAIRSLSSTNVATLACWQSRARGAGGAGRRVPAGLAAHQAARLFAGDARDRRARRPRHREDGAGHPRRCCRSPRPKKSLGAAGSLTSQRSHMVTCATRDRTSAAYCWNRTPRSRRLPTWATIVAEHAREAAGRPVGAASTPGSRRSARHEGREPGEDGCGLERRRSIGSDPQSDGSTRRTRRSGCLPKKDKRRRGSRQDIQEIARFWRGRNVRKCLVTIPASGRGPRRSWS